MTNKDQTEEAYTLLIKIIKKIGWDIAIPTGGEPEDDDNVHGAIIGESSYIDYILKHLP